MMTLLKKSIFIISFIPTILFGQETKKVTIENENPKSKEVYYVLKSNKSIRHGNFQKFNFNDALQINGYYKNGHKDSIWTEFRWDGKYKKSIGSYFEDKKVGVWEFYNFKGEQEQKYDFTKNEIIFFKLDDKEKIKEYRVINGSDSIKTILDRPPLYIGGSLTMAETLVDNLHYPETAIENELTGKVYISFIIDNKGNLSNYKIFKGIGSGCDEEALRVVKLIPNQWLPGLIDGNTVNVEYILPIHFSLE
jgi:protein TonB